METSLTTTILGKYQLPMTVKAKKYQTQLWRKLSLLTTIQQFEIQLIEKRELRKVKQRIHSDAIRKLLGKWEGFASLTLQDVFQVAKELCEDSELIALYQYEELVTEKKLS